MTPAVQHIEIDLEFRALIPPLATAEYAQLEANIQAAGLARDPLVLWGAVLLDGHNRYEICRRLGLPFTTTPADVADRDAAKVWILENQLGRRNLPDFVRAECALKIESLIAAQAKDRQHAAGEQGREGGRGHKKTLPSDLAEGFRGDRETRTKLAKMARVSNGTMGKVKRLVREAGEPVLHQLRAGRTSIDKAHRNLKKAQETQARAEKVAQVKATQPAPLMGVDIRHCAMADLLPTISGVDAIITDPPYGHESIALYGELARLAKLALRPGGVLVTMCGQTCLPEVLAAMTPHLPYRWMGAVLMPGRQTPAQHDRHVYTAWKPILIFGGTRFFHDVIRGDAPPTSKWHHWQQDEAVIAQLVEALTDPGQTVVDPFLGGGTTAVVCKKLARPFIGCDLDAAAVATTRDRLLLETA